MTARGRAPLLTLVTDRHATGGRPLPEVVARALAGLPGTGVDPADVAVQLREKDLSGRSLVDLARGLRAVTAGAGVALYVNDRPDVALAVGADGVHLGGQSLSAGEVARIAPGLAIGVSTHGLAELETARAAGGGAIAFAFFGPIHDTPAKRAFGAPLGVGALTAAAAAIDLPLIAIGGVTPPDAGALLLAGARGVACIRGILGAPEPALAIQEFCKHLHTAAAHNRHRPVANT